MGSFLSIAGAQFCGLTTVGLTNALDEPFFDVEEAVAVALQEYAVKADQKSVLAGERLCVPRILDRELDK
jgi:hypothetical protein